MIELSISSAVTILGGIGSLFTVYVALNNRIVKLEERGLHLVDKLKLSDIRHEAMAGIIELNAKEVSKALNANSIAITELKGAIQNINR